MTETENTPARGAHEGAATGARRHEGGCHCGAIRFAATLDASRGSRCNCSICTKIAQLGAMTKPANFTLLRGEDALGGYAWGSKTGTRYFCRTCGVHCFGRGNLPELGGEYVSINLNALDGLDPSLVAVTYWDGRHDNWMAGMRDVPWPVHASSNDTTRA